ncbi:MAG: amino acid permease [Proteobacteria bacterium]|nr:amino acid permease [Pseudomonadota bacterium]
MNNVNDNAGAGLKRQIGLGTSIILVIANMIGTGIFTTSGFIIESLQDPKALLICWIIGGVFALSGALCYGELGSIFPRAGGEYVFLKECFGERLGFLSGWISLIVGFSAPIAASSIAFSKYFFNSVFESKGLQVQDSLLLANAPSVLAIGIILLFSFVHCYSVSIGSRVQNALTGFKICLILCFVVAGFLYGKGSMSHFSIEFDPTILTSGGFATSLIFISFAYSGWNAAAYMGGEIKNPSKNIPLSLFIGTVVVICLYLLLNLLYVYALSLNSMSGKLEIGAVAAAGLFGPNVGRFFSGAVTICLLSVVSAMIMAGPRVYYAMAKDGLFFNLFSRLTKTQRVPAYAIILQALIAIIMVITSSFDKLLLYIGFTLSIFAVLTVLGLMYLRARMPDSKQTYKTFGYPVTPLIFILGNMWIIIFCVKENPIVTFYGALTIISGLIFYFIFKRRQERGD